MVEVTSEFRVPKKLKDDAIVEAVCLIKIKTSELAEMLIGVLTQIPAVKGYSLKRMPLADIPPQLRTSTPSLVDQPTHELRNKDGSRMVRVSEGLLSYHIIGQKRYVGWESFRSEFAQIFREVLDQLPETLIHGAALRYINAIERKRHHINDVPELALNVSVRGETLSCPINLNYMEFDGPSHTVTTRIAHPSFVQGTLPKDTSVIVDVEVSSRPSTLQSSNLKEAFDWIDRAHDLEKRAFFKLIPPTALAALTEE